MSEPLSSSLLASARFSPAVVMLCGLLLLAGCGGGGIAGLYPVTGTVTYQGKAVDGATVSFLNESEGRPATAITKSDGTYELFTLDSSGALPGSYRVVVSKTEAGPEVAPDDLGFDPVTGADLSMEQSAANAGKRPTKPKDLIPAKYSSPTSTPLTVEVKNSNNVIDLKLE